MEYLDCSNITLSNTAAFNILKVHYCTITNLKSIQYELFSNNTFLSSEDNVDILCKAIVKQTKLEEIHIQKGYLLSVESRVKILQACCKITTLNSLPKELYNDDQLLN